MLLDHVEDLPALDDPSIVAAVLLGQVAGIEIEIGLSQDLLERLAKLRAEPLVGECEPPVEVLAEDHLGKRLDQGVIEDLRLAERPDRAPPLVRDRLQVDRQVGMPLPQPPEPERRGRDQKRQRDQNPDDCRVATQPGGGQQGRTGDGKDSDQ